MATSQRQMKSLCLISIPCLAEALARTSQSRANRGGLHGHVKAAVIHITP
nr:MAG TPA: hypothetical protein [Caudoviricetes sp.]